MVARRQQIAFIRDKDPNVALYVINALGGAERKLIDLPWARYFNLQWTRDGKSLIFAEKTSPKDAYDSLHFFAIF